MMRRFGGAALLLVAACGSAGAPPSSEDAANKGSVTMRQTATDKNQLVDFGANPGAPEAPDIGIAIALTSDKPGGGSVYHVGMPIVLVGSYRADGKLLIRTEDNPAAAITLTLTRIDVPDLQMLPLYSVKAKITSPNAGTPPAYGRGFRQGGQFKVDLRLFFELADEPGKYALLATLDTFRSEKISFEIVK